MSSSSFRTAACSLQPGEPRNSVITSPLHCSTSLPYCPQHRGLSAETPSGTVLYTCPCQYIPLRRLLSESTHRRAFEMASVLSRNSSIVVSRCIQRFVMALFKKCCAVERACLAQGIILRICCPGRRRPGRSRRRNGRPGSKTTTRIG